METRIFNNQELSKLFGHNLAKWKRWSREFLPPDPTAGLQCGVTRKYTSEEAFTVFLGGYLVGSLNFSIPESRQSLTDLIPWLQKMHFYPWGKDTDNKTWFISIRRAGAGFQYEATGVISRVCIDKEKNLYREEYVYRLIEGKNSGLVDLLNSKKLSITHLIEVFKNKMLSV
ncbi:MAG: hypothetical protein ISS59_01050 [Desulfobacteraceae bacterium]|nr:hypothetical protein [Desulfobacteraceae bacterium]